MITRPDQYVGVTTYAGDGSSNRLIEFSGKFAPDLVYIKRRNSTNNLTMTDTVRGAQKNLRTSTTGEETTDSNSLDGFRSTGFIVGSDSAFNGGDMVAWGWKAGGNKNTFNVDDVGYATAAAAGLTAGDTTPTGASVGTKQGFSIIKYTGPNDTNNHEVPHRLSQAPDFIITKNLDTTFNWDIYHSSLADDAYLIFTDAATRAQGFSGRPTSTVFKTEHDYSTNENQDYIAYLWHDVPGLQKFGSYEGNSVADGPFVELGFKPAIIWLKNADNGSERHWCIVDGTRTSFNKSASAEVLFADDAQVESYANDNYGQFGSKPCVDILSNGFKVREGDTGGVYTQTNRPNTIIYCAWAEAPTVNLFGAQSNAR